LNLNANKPSNLTLKVSVAITVEAQVAEFGVAKQTLKLAAEGYLEMHKIGD